MHRCVGMSVLAGLFFFLGVSVSGACMPPKSPEIAKLDPVKALGLVIGTSDTTGCLSIKNDRLQSGETLWIVSTAGDAVDSARAVRGEIVKRRHSACEVGRGALEDSDSHYDIRFIGGDSPVSPGLGVVTRKTVSLKQIDPKRVRMIVSSSNYELYDCGSTEGIHFFVREGSKTVWHGYYYLAFDVEPDCREADFEDLKR